MSDLSFVHEVHAELSSRGDVSAGFGEEALLTALSMLTERQEQAVAEHMRRWQLDKWANAKAKEDEYENFVETIGT